MDRTTWIAVILCSAGIIFFWTRANQRAEELRLHRAILQAEAAAKAEEEKAKNPSAPPAEAPAPVPAPTPEVKVDRQEYTLENPVARFVFTNVGGGIARVELKEHKSSSGGPIIINQHGPQPIGEIVEGQNLGKALACQVTQPDPQTIVFTAENESKIKIVKTYQIEGDSTNEEESSRKDPYTASLQVDLTNNSPIPHKSNDYYVYTGTITPMHPKETDMYLLFNWSEDGKADREVATWFDGGGFLFFKRAAKDVLVKNADPLNWAGPCNQFYASIVMPTHVPKGTPGSFWARRFDVHLSHDPTDSHKNHALHGGVGLGPINLPPGQSQSHQFQIYTGPRELARLQKVEKLSPGMAGLMHYDDTPIFGAMFGIIPLMSKALLKTMVWLYGMVHNWGVAILILVCILRCILWPLHAKSNYTMKRMAKLGPMMTELREKYKDDPSRVQQETMRLYKDYGINPMGGCLPALIQLPIFLGFYKMLQSAVELRNRDFLWVKDLSMPDSVYEFANFSLFGVGSLNLMPLLMAGTMVLQMSIGPKASDKMQQRVLMLMPIIFLFICYNFASALALYWTGQNIFSIVQTWIMNKRPEPELKKRPPRPVLARFDPRARQAGQPEPKPKKRRPRTGG